MSRGPAESNDVDRLISATPNGIFGRRSLRESSSDSETVTPVAPNRKPANPLLELRVPAEVGMYVASNPLLLTAKRGTGRPVIVIPGFLSGDSATMGLRIVLRQLNHRPTGWGQGLNLGPKAQTLEGVYRLLDSKAQLTGAPVSIVGWSLGGVFARLVAQEHPHLVEQVISLGSPFNIGDSEPTTISFIWDYLEARGDGFVRDRDNVDLDQLPVPSTAIYSKTDGIVSWKSCVQSPSEHSENIEVYGSHCGLGFNGMATAIIADRLAQGPGQWRPFRPYRPFRRLFPSFKDQD